MWAFSKTRIFTVRSCYHSILEDGSGEGEDGGSFEGVTEAQWEWIWSLKVPLKVRNFLWQACHNIIPTRAAIVRRKVGWNPFCEFCHSAVETEVHIFFECPYFQSIWSNPPFQFRVPVPAPNFTAGIRWIRDNSDHQILPLAAVTIWNIWHFRNCYYHDSMVG